MNASENTSDTSLRLIVTIVNRGYADSVIQAASKAGAQGATVLIGRGMGIHEKARILGVPIEPEKEVVLILVRPELADQVLGSIGQGVDLTKPGRGLAFVVDVIKAIGISHALRNVDDPSLDKDLDKDLDKEYPEREEDAES